MHFYLKHAVGNRERWKTDDTLSHASAVIIANEVAAIPGVTGLVVNPRIGSVTLTVADAAAKARTLAYFESLAVNPPILRPDRAVIAAEDLEAAKRCGEMALQPLRREDLPPGIVPRTIYEIERGFTTMPLLNVFSRLRDLLGKIFPGLFMIGRTAAKAAQVGQAMGKAALTRRTGEAPAPIEDDAELDFSSLARYIFLRPFLPMVVNIGNAVLDSIPYLIEGVKNAFDLCVAPAS